MTIASAITAAQGRVADCYTAISNKGGTLPATQNLANMPTAIGSIPTGGTIDSLTVTPTTSQQMITATGGVDGYSPITVNAVTSSIDANISAGNIKSGVSILGVSGSVTELVGETRSVSLTSSSGNTFTPTSGKNGITSITVNPNNQARSVTPSTSAQTLNVNSGYSGNGTISVSAVTSSIDNNITEGNIKNGVTILGVTGNYTGTSPTLITKSITQNGTYNASSDNADGYSSVTVNVSGGGGYTEFPSYQVSNGVASKRSGALTGNEFSNITSVSDYGLYYAFYNCTGLTGALNLSSLSSVGSNGLYCAFYNCTGLTGNLNLSSLTSIGESGLGTSFYGCSGLTSVNLSSLSSVANYGLGNAFQSCSRLTSVNLSSLSSVGGSGFGNAFERCSRLTSVNLSSLSSVGSSGLYYAFSNCSRLTSVDLSSLSSVGSSGLSNAFRSCKVLTDVYFNSLTTTSFGNKNAFQNMLSSTGTTTTHTLHFPSNLQSTISGLTGYPNFGGTSGYVTLSFDLPATS